MTKSEGSGFNVVLRLADGAMKLLPEDQARSFVDGLTDAELAEAMLAASEAARAAGGSPNLFYESAAARLEGRDVASESSLISTTCCRVWTDSTEPHCCVRPKGHAPPCSEWPFTSDSKLKVVG